MTFFYLGKDDYSRFTKVATFLILVLVPIFFAMISGVSNLLLDMLDPAPPLVPINLQNKQQVNQDSQKAQLLRT